MKQVNPWPQAELLALFFPNNFLKQTKEEIKDKIKDKKTLDKRVFI